MTLTIAEQISILYHVLNSDSALKVSKSCGDPRHPLEARGKEMSKDKDRHAPPHPIIIGNDSGGERVFPCGLRFNPGHRCPPHLTLTSKQNACSRKRSQIGNNPNISKPDVPSFLEVSSLGVNRHH
ncbi:unnamed protein product [Ilex paraguariensis]|uniref:Uncharacterized protein n=1 Tax=Ilex paraguariensis TaxID=185542 RepID=A0ABC8RS32_9AQUA